MCVPMLPSRSLRLFCLTLLRIHVKFCMLLLAMLPMQAAKLSTLGLSSSSKAKPLMIEDGSVAGNNHLLTNNHSFTCCACLRRRHSWCCWRVQLQLTELSAWRNCIVVTPSTFSHCEWLSVASIRRQACCGDEPLQQPGFSRVC